MEDLSICIYSTDKFPKSFKGLFEDNYKCDRWSKFVNLLAQLSKLDKPTELSLFEKVSPAVRVLEKAISELEDFSKSSKLIFMKGQLELLEMKQPRYSPDVLLWSAKLFFAYPAAYLCVRNSKVLSLPHPSYLRKLSHIMKSGVNSDHFLYLKKKANLLKPNERVVNLLFDEIYVDKCIDFKSGHLYELSENADTLATTVQSFITSVFSHNKDIVSLFPVSNMTAQDLHNYCCQVLQMLECGYTVLIIISDNNKLNGKMFSLLAGGGLQCCIPNPQHPEKKLSSYLTAFICLSH
ncbi:hypothetical protein JTE90_023762 [Oedothorax gibbosus]|uniref:Transposable element P transposase-like RNase H domain-containing protein n=1 Tax=Oedothorax gibbosus TaxID=931172 RepID=A0AAV6TVM1_9ARAC|nr:hypothetical protein JTE90_023762 [Oedothorax gibbosus]